MNYRSDLGIRKIRIFFRNGLDKRTGNAQSVSLICPSGHESALAAQVAATNPDDRFILTNGLRRLGSP
jgi:hypothetical protein